MLYNSVLNFYLNTVGGEGVKIFLLQKKTPTRNCLLYNFSVFVLRWNFPSTDMDYAWFFFSYSKNMKYICKQLLYHIQIPLRDFCWPYQGFFVIVRVLSIVFSGWFMICLNEKNVWRGDLAKTVQNNVRNNAPNTADTIPPVITWLIIVMTDVLLSGRVLQMLIRIALCFSINHHRRFQY